MIDDVSGNGWIELLDPVDSHSVPVEHIISHRPSPLFSPPTSQA
jgi:hypothetical protein